MIAFIHGFVGVCVCYILDCAIYYNDLLLKLVYLVQNGSLWERDEGTDKPKASCGSCASKPKNWPTKVRK